MCPRTLYFIGYFTPRARGSRLHATTMSVTNAHPKRVIPIVQPLPDVSSHPLLRSLPPSTYLPVELLDVLNHTYFLHLLATDPKKVLPPGKSILSMMSKPHAQGALDGKSTLEEKVTEVIHRAFWDEVRRFLFRTYYRSIIFCRH